MTAAGRELARSVTLRDDKFRLVTFAAGSTPPAWAQARITNPSAWGSAAQSAPTPSGDGPPPSETPDETPESPSPDPDQAPPAEATEAEDEDLLGELPEPPKRGAGSGRDAWAAYAASKGVAVTDDMNRDEIIDAVEAE